MCVLLSGRSEKLSAVTKYFSGFGDAWARFLLRCHVLSFFRFGFFLSIITQWWIPPATKIMALVLLYASQQASLFG